MSTEVIAILVPTALAVLIGFVQWSLKANIDAAERRMKQVEIEAAKLREEMHQNAIAHRDYVMRAEMHTITAKLEDILVKLAFMAGERGGNA